MYSRSGNKPRGVVVQARDRRLLEELAVMRIVDREQAKVVAGFGSTTRANARLLALVRTGLLRRFFLGANVAGRKAIYALSRKGAEFIGVPRRGPRRRKDEVLVADSFVHHQLAVNEIYCALKRGIATISGVEFVRWLGFYGPLAPESNFIPDGYFELKTPSGVLAAFLEVDLGNERLKAWQEKVRNYLQLALSGDCERRFGQSRFHVLTIANSDRTLASIRRVVRTSTEKIFWFTTLDSIGRYGLLGPVWLRPNGDHRESFFLPTP